MFKFEHFILLIQKQRREQMFLKPISEYVKMKKRTNVRDWRMAMLDMPQLYVQEGVLICQK